MSVLLNKFFYLLPAFDNDDSEGGAPDLSALLEDEATLQKILSSDKVQALLTNKAKELASNDITKLGDNNRRLLDQLKAAKDKASKFEALEGQLQEEEQFEALKTGKATLQQVVDGYVQKARGSWQSDYDKLASEKSEFEKKLGDLTGQLRQRDLSEKIGQAALTHQSFKKSAINHFLKAAGETWKTDEDGNLVARGADGNIVMSKNGKPIAPSEWIQSLADNPEYQHYFDFPQGSGARPGASGRSGSVMSRADFQRALATADKKTEAELLSKRASGELQLV